KQSIYKLSSLHLSVDGNEVSGAYAVWLSSTSQPMVMALCRGAVPILEGSSSEKAKKGAYILTDFNDSDGKKVLIASSGSEVCICVEAKELLITCGYNVRLVSFPCWELFEEQSKEYQQSVMMLQERLKGEVKTVYVEPSSPFGWDKYFDVHVGMTTFGASAAKKFVYTHFGFTKENIADKAANAYKQ
ncbi:transketolase, partial [Cardiosporidium cionae]